jgi:ABC-type uncharacterized transport system substrate-binding protein
MLIPRILIAMLFAAAIVKAEDPRVVGKKILVIESYHAEFEWDRDYLQAIKERFAEQNSLTFFQMDTKRRPFSQHPGMADKAWKKYLEIKPDLVFLGDDAALKLVGPKLSNERTSIVYLGINSNPRYYFDTPPRNMTGVLERPVFKRCISLIKELIPDAKRVLLLFDADLTSKIIKKEIFDGLSTQMVSQIEVDIELIENYNNWQDTVKNPDHDYDFIIIGLYQAVKDARGQAMDPEEVIRWTAANAQAPLFGFWNFSIGKQKAIGGLVLDGHEMGSLAADLAVKIFTGTSPDQLTPIYENKGVFLFSKSQLARWNLQLTEEIKQKTRYVQ